MSATAAGQAPAASVSWEQALAWRMRRQFLGASAAGSVSEVVDRLCGVQAQVASAADLAVRLRLAAPGPAAVPDPGAVSSALASGEIFKTWAMRGTLHLLTPDLGRNVLALMASGKSWERPSWQRYFGMSPKEMERLRQATYDVLGNGPMTREELIAAITVLPGLGHAAEQLASGWGTLLKPAAWHGLLAFGPNRGTRVTFMRTDQAARGWRGLPSAEEAAPLAVRAYLGAYGPSTPETFSTWLAGGYFARTQLRGWFADLGDELAAIDVDGEQQFLLREHLEEMTSTQPNGTVRLVPGFDQAVLGPTTRDVHVLDPARRTAVSRTAGWIAPVVLVDGRINGTWETRDDALTIDWWPERGAPPNDELDAEVARIGRLLNRPLTRAMDARSGLRPMNRPPRIEGLAAAPVTVRPENPEEAAAVRAVHQAAFETASEADLVELIRSSDRFVPGLSLVAEEPGGRIVGHVLVSWVDLIGPDGSTRQILDLGPIGVLPERQNAGVGAALMRAAIAEAERMGEPVIVLIGHPWYYPRFGFEPARPLGLEYPREISDEVWMVRRLAAWTPQLRGRVSYPPAWDGLV